MGLVSSIFVFDLLGYSYSVVSLAILRLLSYVLFRSLYSLVRYIRYLARSLVFTSLIASPFQKPSVASTAPTTTSTTPSAPTAPKRKPSRRANTAERRATHNAVERQRRETLNGRFL
ncbi:hypothetical protein SCHPADRAFT_837376, partial [Schizopora paradoxa]